ncbi:hypothetical protein [uncultured Gimesia sp.]|uniref:hypothetical protein n=1 Tax=uncultured Gimesia sp. TaxID=1678688 RepID=UPI0026051F7E|nr:hypothetical protein [uncultured Gimesia sp.]
MVDKLKSVMTKIWDQIDEARFAETYDERKQLITIPIRELQRLLDAGYKDALYPLGYAYYAHPDRRPGSPEVDLTENYLIQAITEGVEADLSRLYLAYHYHDFHRFEDSSKIIAQVDKNVLGETLMIRCSELELCNQLLTGDENENDFPKLLATYAEIIAALSEPDIPPILLIDTLETLFELGKLPMSCLPSLMQLDDAYIKMMGDQWFRKLIS